MLTGGVELANEEAIRWQAFRYHPQQSALKDMHPELMSVLDERDNDMGPSHRLR